MICILFFSQSPAQLAKTDPLYRTIMSKDSLLFSVGFNTCNIGQMESVLVTVSNSIMTKLVFRIKRNLYLILEMDYAKTLQPISQEECW